MDDNRFGWIWLRDVTIENASVGHNAHEHTLRQPVVIDAGLWSDIARAARTDHVRDTVNWARVAQSLRDVTLSRHFVLIESLCEALASMILQRFGVTRVRIEVRKPQSLPSGTTAVAIERTAEAPPERRLGFS